MTRWLLDTHVLIWALAEPVRLLTADRKLIRYSDSVTLIPLPPPG